jgi:Na+/melibiose symporter-like transporter
LSLDDHVLSLAGSVGMLCNGISKFVWATMFDYIGFKKVYRILLFLQVIACSTIFFARDRAVLYVIVVSLTFFCEGGHFSLFPPTCVKIFGIKSGG